MPILSHKIQLKPNTSQITYFKNACGAARKVYNEALAMWNAAYEAGQKPNAYALKLEFNKVKYTKFPWLKEVHRDCSSQPFADLAKAFSNFFKKRTNHPVFKCKGRSKDTFYVASDQFKVDGYRVKLPKIGWVKMTEELRFSGSFKSARVSRVADRWFISIAVDLDHYEPIRSETIVPMGIDLGIKATATCTDGSIYNSPKPLRKFKKKLVKQNRRLSRKKRGSNNYNKQRVRLARLHAHIANVRRDFIHKMTTEVVRKSQAIVLEDLSVLNMLKNHNLAKALVDASFAEIRRQFEYKCLLHSVPLMVTNRYFPSSRLCSKCGWKDTELTLKDRVFKCKQCGLEIDRDLNAAYNLVNQLPKAIGEVKPVDRLDPSLFKEDRDEAGIEVYYKVHGE